MAKEEMITVGEMALTNKGHVTRPGIGKHFLMNNRVTLLMVTLGFVIMVTDKLRIVVTLF